MLQKVLTASDCECKEEDEKKIIDHDHAVKCVLVITWKQTAPFRKTMTHLMVNVMMILNDTG